MKNYFLFAFLLSLCCVPLLHAQDFEHQHKNRIGIELNEIAGFQSIPMVVYENGNTSDMRFGDCIGFGVNYGHQFAKHLDLSSSFGYYWTSLTPKTSYAKAVFSSFRFTLTPAFVIPLGHGGRNRFRVGAGLDFCFSNKLVIEMARVINGCNDTWYYDRTIGYHFNALYESSFFRDNWSSFIGVQYNCVGYNFVSSSISHPTDPWLKSPNGDGAGIILGVNHRF